jgi:hypothetical protein
MKKCGMNSLRQQEGIFTISLNTDELIHMALVAE